MDNNITNRISNRIGILVVTFNQYDITRNFIIHFIEKFIDKEYDLLILDNNSNDLTYERILREFPKIDIRKLNDNYGCVTGRNIGIVELIESGYEYILILDNDIIIKDAQFFDKLTYFMDNNRELHACCPIVKFNINNRIQTAGTRIHLKYFAKNITIPDSDFIHTLPGCAQFIRAQTLIDFGLFDNDLTPFSIEDFEWGYRNYKHLKLKCAITAEVYHLQEIKKKPSKTTIALYIRGRIIFLKKHFNIFTLAKEIYYFFSIIFKYKSYNIPNLYFKALKYQPKRITVQFNDFKNIINRFYN